MASGKRSEGVVDGGVGRLGLLERGGAEGLEVRSVPDDLGDLSTVVGGGRRVKKRSAICQEGGIVDLLQL